MKSPLWLRIAFSLMFLVFKIRYRLVVKGVEKCFKEKKESSFGTLFLPNHPAIFVDPLMVLGTIYSKTTVRSLAIDYVYDHWTSNWLMKATGAIRTPYVSIKSLKDPSVKTEIEEGIQEIISGLKQGENYLIYPSGQCKDSNLEVIAGSSTVYNIVKSCPDVNIVLIRIKGLFGSSFSRYWEGRTPSVGSVLFHSIPYVIKNFIFFTPKRDVVVEFHEVPIDFPYDAPTRLSFNRYLEDWYNQPDGLTDQEGVLPGDSTILLSLSAYGEAYPKKIIGKELEKYIEIPKEVKKKVLNKLVELSELDAGSIHSNMHLHYDVGLDSLEVVDLLNYLSSEFSLEIERISDVQPLTVGKLIFLASQHYHSDNL
ncbi:MAG: phosphopantetheine-binding protein [Chlamydiota bacterium]